MSYLVTGAAGFIGSHVAETLLARGEQVIGVDNFYPYYSPERKWRNVAALLKQPTFQLVEGDFRNFELMEQIFAEQRPDRILHIGAMAGVRASIQQPDLYIDVNMNGSRVLMQLASKYGVEQFVLASTSSVYGKQAVAPFVEDDPADRPLSPYAASKRAAEMLGYTFHNLYQLPLTVVRLFTVYGPRGRPDMTPLKFTEAIARGETITLFDGGTALYRDFTYIDDIVAGILAAAEQPLGYEIINLGNAQPVQMRNFVSILERLIGKPARIETPATPATEPPLTCADLSKAQRLLNYRPATGIEEGLSRLWEWYCSEEQARHD